MNVTRYLLFGREIWRVETTGQPDRGDCISVDQPIGFVSPDLPTWHRLEDGAE